MISEPTLTETKLTTGEELAAMGNLGRCELIEGRIVSMAPTGDEHGGIEIKIGGKLDVFATTHKLGKVRVGEVGVYTHRNPDTVRGADALFISNERYAQKKSPSFLDVAPELVVEILSPNDSWSDVTQKLREYLAIGVQLVWVVDPRARIIYAYRSMTEVREFTENDDLPGDEILPGFLVKVAELFEI
ncbi:MAG TPA: Uma2 family endonuclease [Anaerolineae bacterium]|nr:Uma2 family endonuclease [Anaerolineae bacterium]